MKSVKFIYLLDIGWHALSNHDVPGGRAEPEHSTVHHLKNWGYPEGHCRVVIMEVTWSDLFSKSDGLRALRAVGIGKKQFLG